MAQETNEYRENRLASLKALAEMGFTPYGHAYPHEDLKAVRAGFEEGKEVSVAGRLLMIRRMGKMNFCTLNDGTDHFQLIFKRDELLQAAQPRRHRGREGPSFHHAEGREVRDREGLGPPREGP